jgi:hypothetical protein
MGTKLIRLNQLNSVILSDLGTVGLRTAVARDDFGDVNVWRSDQESGVDYQDACTSEFTDLIVLGEPKAVAMKMVAELAVGRGVYEKPISMTLAQGLNWALHWYTGESSEKAEVIDRLIGMRNRSFQRLEHDRFHLSDLWINDLLSAIDQAIQARDWLSFLAAVDRLYKLDALGIDQAPPAAGVG